MITKEQAFGIYIGQKIIFENLDDNCKWHILQTPLMGIMQDTNNIFYCQFLNSVTKEKAHRYLDDCKLILRPFESMTEEENKEYESFRLNRPILTMDIKHKQIEYLISIGIDVFNLKERGWAVYESEVKK